MSEATKVNIKCPECNTPFVTAFKDRSINGMLQHKCKCRRYWNVDYTNKTIVWVKGKETVTSTRKYQLNLATGISLPVVH